RGRNEGRCAPAEKHAGCRRGGSSLDVAHTCLDIRIDQVRAVGPRREVAVITPRRTKRNMYVHTKRHPPTVPTGAPVGPHKGSSRGASLGTGLGDGGAGV